MQKFQDIFANLRQAGTSSLKFDLHNRHPFYQFTNWDLDETPEALALSLVDHDAVKGDKIEEEIQDAITKYMVASNDALRLNAYNMYVSHLSTCILII